MPQVMNTIAPPKSTGSVNPKPFFLLVVLFYELAVKSIVLLVMGNELSFYKPDEYKTFEILIEVKVSTAANQASPVFLNFERMINDKGVLINKIILNDLKAIDYMRKFRLKGPKLAVIWPLENGKDKDIKQISFKYIGKSVFVRFEILCNVTRLLKKEGLPIEFSKNLMTRVEWIIMDLLPTIESIINTALSQVSSEKFVVYDLIPVIKEGDYVSEDKVFDAVMNYAKKSELLPGLKNDKLAFIEDENMYGCACFV